jgi:predicted nucleic acid-binding protein
MMVLVDTSVWVSHFRRKNSRLEDLLLLESVCCHPLIIGELACGNLHNRSEILNLLNELPTVAVANEQDALHYIEKYRLMGKGLSIIDVHLLASASLSTALLWTEDKRMGQTARQLGISI